MISSHNNNRSYDRAPWLAYPVMLYLSCLAIGPLLILLAYSFYQKVGYEFVPGFWLGNYKDILTRELFLSLTLKSLVYGGLVCVLTLILAIPTAQFICWKGGKWKNLMLMGLLIPLYTGDLIRVYAWRIILGINGVVNTLLLELGIIGAPLEILLFSNFSVLISMVYIYLPFMVLPIWANYEGVDYDFVDAGNDLGAGPWRRFRKIILPLILPGILAGSALVFIPVTGEFLSPNLLGGPTGITLMNVITSQFGASFNWPLGSALAWFLLFAVAIVVSITVFLFTRISWVRAGLGNQ